MNQPSTLLEISGLTVRPSGQPVLADFSVTVERGTLHAIVGPNGAGKTTLLSAILGLIPFEGRIVAHWQGRGRIAYVPQQFHVDRTLPVTVADFLALTRQERPVCLGVTRAARRRIAALLERVGLNGFEKRTLSVLSGGELRRVLLANALDPLPELLILDEPVSGLDESAARWLDETLISLKGEMTVLMVSHDPDQVRRVADRVTVLAGLKASTTTRPSSTTTPPSSTTTPPSSTTTHPANMTGTRS
jgi:zinc transport system ATP-binding protein